MFKSLQVRLQQYMTWKLPDVQAGFRKDRGIRDQIANIHCIIEKAAEFQKNIYFCFVDYTKAFDCVYHNKMWKFLREREYQTILPAFCEACAGQEEKVAAKHGTTDWFRIGSGVCEGCVLSPCLFDLYAEYVKWNDRLDESQAETKIARRNISNLIYADDTTLMAESE